MLLCGNSQTKDYLHVQQIFQGIAPTFVAPFSDTAGRRPAYIICFTIYFGANLGLALQNNYVALLILRMVQSSGSSGTVALSNAIAADIVTSAERGSYMGYASFGAMLGPSLAPVIGGLLAQYCGWKWIFWFLLILSASVFLPMMLFFPETCRVVVGNGSLPPPIWNMSLWSLLQRYRARRRRANEAGDAELGRTVTNSSQVSRPEAKISWPSPVGVYRILADRVNLIILLSIALLFAAYYAIIASVPARFAQQYGYSTLDLSLIFIPIGIGSIVAAFTNGRLMDWNYRRHARRLGISIEKGAKSKQHNMLEFPIECARLEVGMPLLFLGAACTVAYGWCVDKAVSVAGPIVLLFFVGYSLVAGFLSLSVLIVDLNRAVPATATAANNFVRCLFGAGASAIVNPLTEAVGYGWTCTIAAAVWLSFTPMLFLLMRYGLGWRQKKAERIKALQNAKTNNVETNQGDRSLAEVREESSGNDGASEPNRQNEVGPEKEDEITAVQGIGKEVETSRYTPPIASGVDNSSSVKKGEKDVRILGS